MSADRKLWILDMYSKIVDKNHPEYDDDILWNAPLMRAIHDYIKVSLDVDNEAADDIAHCVISYSFEDWPFIIYFEGLIIKYFGEVYPHKISHAGLAFDQALRDAKNEVYPNSQS